MVKKEDKMKGADDDEKINPFFPTCASPGRHFASCPHGRAPDFNSDLSMLGNLGSGRKTLYY